MTNSSSPRSGKGGRPGKHADQRRRLYAAMLDHPQGITSKDFAAFPAIDGAGPIPRVAARIEELREEHTIPKGIKDPDGYAIYRLHRDPVAEMERSGFVLRTLCHGCLTLRHTSDGCPHGHRLEDMWSDPSTPTGACPRQSMEQAA